jgi:uncharacterized SAM-binding protein YcdF (DUF218 family)
MTYLQPLLPLLLLFSLTVSLMRRHHPGLRNLSVLASLGLFVWAWPPSACLISGSLEWWYRPGPSAVGEEPQAIVVLSGGVEDPEPGVENRLARNSAVRCGYAGRLHRKWPKALIVVSGDRATTALMRAQLAADGVPQEMIWTESQSSSTAEHALRCAELLHGKSVRRIALVTEAYHMPRSEACFRKQGFQVQPAPCAFRTALFRGSIGDWVPGAAAIRQNEQAFHEWIGLAYYWLRGYI